MKIHYLKYLPVFLAVLFTCSDLPCIAQQQVNFRIPADSSIKVHVRNIIIYGNKKTKDYIILREMTLNAGDSIVAGTINVALEKSREFIYNTTLFESVKVESSTVSEFDLDIIITVAERWYIFPIPQFQLVDRSFNEWLVKYNASFSRVNYGVKFEHKNLSGRKDQLKLYFITGYTKNISFSYSEPYSNPALTNGYGFGGGYTQTREISYKTDSANNFLNYNVGSFVRNTWFIRANFLIRKALKKRENFNVLFTRLKIADTILTKSFNPNYFNSASSKQGVFDLSYTLQFIDVNNILYPLNGYSFNLTLQKRNLGWKGGLNMFSVFTEYKRYLFLGKKWYAGMELSGKIKLPFTQPYYNLRALGTDNAYLRGLEYFVIDGVVYGLARFNLKKEIFNFSLPTYLRSKTFSRIPIRIFAKVFTDAGYVYSDEQPLARLNNRFLYTEGFGIDIVTFYDFHLRLEYAFNQLGQKGLFLHN